MSTYSEWALSAAADTASIYSTAWEDIEPLFADLEAKEESGQDVAPLLLWKLPQLQSALERASSKAHEVAVAATAAISQEAGGRALQELRDQHGAELAGLLAGVLEAARQELGATITAYLSKYNKELVASLNRTLRTGQLNGDSIKNIMADLENAFGVFIAPTTARDMLKGLTGTAAKTARMVFNELATARSDLYQQALTTGSYTGVLFTAGPGPCPSRICPTRAGKYMGQDALAELKRWPRHPWCKCTVSFLTSNQQEI